MENNIASYCFKDDNEISVEMYVHNIFDIKN